MGDNNSIGRDAHGSVQGRSNQLRNTDSFNREGLLSSELITLFDQLKGVVANVRPEMRVRDAEVLDAQLLALENEAKSPTPDQHRLAVTSKGLIEAAKTVGEIAVPVVGVVGEILKICGATLSS